MFKFSSKTSADDSTDPKETQTGFLNMSEITSKMKSMIKTTDEVSAKNKMENHTKRDAHITKFIEERNKECDKFISLLEGTVSKMANDGSTHEYLTNDNVVLKSGDYDMTRDDVCDHPCHLKVHEYFTKRYNIPVEFKSSRYPQSSKISYSPSTDKFLITIETTNEFMNEYQERANHMTPLDDKNAVRETYAHFMT